MDERTARMCLAAAIEPGHSRVADAVAEFGAAEIWAGFVGSQTPQEFIEISRSKGYTTTEEAVAAYVRELPDMFPYDEITADQLPEIEKGLLRYLAEHGIH